VLLLLLARLDHEKREGKQIELVPDLASEMAARVRAWRTLHHWTASTRAAPRHPRDQPVPRDEDAMKLDHLSDLDRMPDEDQLLWAAEEELVVACMRKRGFSYLPNLKDDDPESGQRHVHMDRRGDVEAAHAKGYGLFERMQAGESPNSTVDRNAEPLARMTELERGAFLDALRGPTTSPADPSVRHMVESVPLPGGGAAYWYRDSCLAQARHRLYGDDYEHNEIGYGQAILRNELLTRADEDPDYKKSLDAWRGCMRARWFDEDQPAAAAKRLAGEYHAGKLSRDELRVREVAVATADAECFLATDIERVRQAAESRAEENLLAQNSERLLAMKRVRDEALERAEIALGDSEL
jgi:hypothetical protein